MSCSTYIDESQPHVRRCSECGIASPTSDTNYTLLSSRYGWRLSRSRGAEGMFVEKWRCPVCWARMLRKTSAPEHHDVAAS